jgi:hypothetical protein
LRCGNDVVADALLGRFLPRLGPLVVTQAVSLFLARIRSNEVDSAPKEGNANFRHKENRSAFRNFLPRPGPLLVKQSAFLVRTKHLLEVSNRTLLKKNRPVQRCADQPDLISVP